MLKTRERQIFKMMYDSSPDIYTSKQLALLVNVSSRTIKSDLDNINSELQKKQAKINSARGKGYWIDKKNKEQIAKELSHELLRELSTEKIMIFEFLLFRKSFIPIYEIAEKFFYSESSLLKIINEINPELEKHNLKILKEPRKGVKLIGKEKNLRIMHAEILKKQNIIKNGFFKSTQMNNEILYKDFNNIQSFLIEFQRKHEISLSDIAQASLAIDIIITLNRIKTNENIDIKQNEINDLKQNKEWYYALDLVSMLENKFNVSFSESETGFLSIHLLAANLLNDELPKTFDGISENVEEKLLLQIVNWIEAIDKQFNTKLQEDIEFISSITLHLKPMLKRLQHGITLTNPWIKNLKEDHNKAYEISVSLAQEIQETTNYTVTDNEIAYIAMHIGGSLERNNNQKNIDVVIICASGIGTSRFLKSRLKKYYPEFNVTHILPSYSPKLNKMKDEIIISTVPIENINNNIVHVSPMLTGEDQEKIENFLQNYNYNFDDYFKKELFLGSFQATDKFSVLEEAFNLLYKNGYVKPDYFNDLIEREELSSTEIGNLIAIPHVFSQNVIKNGICVIILKEPIIWENHSVQMILALSFDNNDDENAIKIIERISEFRDDFDLINNTITSKEFEAFKNNFESIKDF